MTEKSCPVLLTPPSTPPKPDTRRAPASSDALSLQKLNLRVMGDISEAATKSPESLVTSPKRSEPAWEDTSPRPCAKKYQMCGSAGSGYEEFGRGVWSIVYRASEISDSQTPAVLTPPTTPVGNSKFASAPGILAIKVPARGDAYKILHHEARVLTYLHFFKQASDHIIPFHGYNDCENSLVLDSVPLNLETYVKAAAKSVRANFSTRTMFDPVVGVQEWQSLANKLVDGLTFLHFHRCIHGDIKPANILLRPHNDVESIKFTPLYCDFSSASIVTPPLDGSKCATQQLTALTPDYASPELFSSLTNPSAGLATMASDIYALGITLLVAATGESPYAGARMEVQKLSMAREGRPLDFARDGSQGTRIMKGRGAETCLRGALEKRVEDRWEIERWKEELKERHAAWK